MLIESHVGSKGELFLPKHLRQTLGFNPGDKIYFDVKDGTLIVRKVKDLLELLDMHPLGDPQYPEEIERDLEDIQIQMMDLSTKED